MGLEVFFGSFLSQNQIFLLLPSFLVCAVGAILIVRRTQQEKLPPGPWSLPIIGHLHLLGELPHQSLYKLSRIHGPLMSLRLGSTVTIVASTPAMAREILQTHDQAFASRPLTAAAVHIHFNRSDIGFAPYGPYWKLMRQICVTDLFTNKRMEGFRPIREEEVGALLRSILEDSSGQVGKHMVLRPKLLAASNNIICRMTLGKKFFELASSSSDSAHNIVALFTEALHLAGLFNVGDYIPMLAGLDLQGYVRRMKIYKQRVKEAVQEVIDARRDERRADPCDFLDVLLSVSSSHNNKLRMPITDDNIKAVLLDMLLGGTDTQTVSIEWGLAELLANPMALKKVQEELDCVVGKARLVQESDIPHLPYLRAVVKETMRLHPVLPLLLPHESTQACRLGGYLIPTKTRAYINVWAIGRDPDAWDNPLVFLPERFLESTVDLHGQHFDLLPFGSGRRKCPGWALGLLDVQLVLASLLQCFDWASNKVPDMSETFGITVMMAHSLIAMATPRLHVSIITSNSSSC